MYFNPCSANILKIDGYFIALSLLKHCFETTNIYQWLSLALLTEKDQDPVPVIDLTHCGLVM